MTLDKKVKKAYDKKFYSTRHEYTLNSAEIILNLLKASLPKIESVVDLGCGVGTWLSVLEKQNIDVLGIDGPWVDQEFLEIKKQNFKRKNLEEKLNLNKKFDLAISLEVAEHLRENKSDIFIQNLTELSDYILFSAAIPFQGGKLHYNEQWQEYWESKFELANFKAIDLVRPQIWNNKNIPVHYRQNIILYVNKDCMKNLNIPKITYPISIVHPELFYERIYLQKTLRGAIRHLKQVIKQRLKMGSKVAE